MHQVGRGCIEDNGLYRTTEGSLNIALNVAGDPLQSGLRDGPQKNTEVYVAVRSSRTARLAAIEIDGNHLGRNGIKHGAEAAFEVRRRHRLIIGCRHDAIGPPVARPLWRLTPTASFT